ncbi:metallophosphoesterase [Bradyrhizobium sp. HKCCYLS2038]|uniref:metallophosphoesterase n=1 Tax=unclassified Bradyrhizobium TaxID=2631580 RepID=UPI003EB7C3D4
MQRVAIISDPHVDIERNAWDNPPRIDADVLVVSGDVAAPLVVGMRWVVDNLCAGVQRVVYVPGNHCFYRGRASDGEDRTYYQDQMVRGREVARSLGIDLLQNDAIEIDGVRYLGGTLWSDLSVLPRGWTVQEAMFYSQRGYLPDHDLYGSMSRDYHNDFRQISYGGPGHRNRFTPSQMLALHRESFAFFKRALSTPFDGPTVCISHVGPASSVEPGMHSWLYGCTDIESLMKDYQTAPEFWIHGHVHKSRDYEIGATRVICNPRGYPDPKAPSGRENPDFAPTLTIEVDPDLAQSMSI